MSDGAILVGDAGGTNVRFALAHSEGLSEIWKRAGADYPTFEAALDAFLAETKPKLIGAAFGLAGQAVDDRVELLNRGWTVDLAAVRARLGVKRTVVVNDFAAMARSAPELSGGQLRVIAPGKADPNGSLAIGGPGTGFGIGVLRKFAEGWIVVGGEGGHQAYTPQTDIEWKLAEKLRRSEGYVSNEFVAAGVGFEETRAALAEVMGLRDRELSQPEVIAAAEAGDAFALEFCRIRARCVMTALGNLALSAASTGGVFIAGGVAQHIEPWLKERATIERFRQRGPRTAMVKHIPISLITSEAAPLIGAACLWRDAEKRGWL